MMECDASLWNKCCLGMSKSCYHSKMEWMEWQEMKCHGFNIQLYNVYSQFTIPDPIRIQPYNLCQFQKWSVYSSLLEFMPIYTHFQTLIFARIASAHFLTNGFSIISYFGLQ